MVAIIRVLVHVCVIAIYIPIIEITNHGFVHFPSLDNNVVLMKMFSVFHIHINVFAPPLLICWLCLYCAVNATLSEEFVQLREEISNFSISDHVISKLVLRRFRYGELVKLVRQADSVFRLFIGYGVLVIMVVLCASLYTLIIEQSDILIWLI